MNLNPDEIPQKDRYKLTTALVLPRPIAWVSSLDAGGSPNLAPFSFFTVASTNPLMMMFCPQTANDKSQKDTLKNVRATGSFVINIVDEATAEAMNQTATRIPPGESEFDFAGLTPVPSVTIPVPRVGESPAAFECELERVVAFNEENPGGGSVVFGRVRNIYLRPDIYDGSYVDIEKLRPIGRLMGNWYAHIDHLFELIRR